MMIGSIVNAAGIVVGGVIGLTIKTPLSPARQGSLKLWLGAATVVAGMWLTWHSVNGTVWQMGRQLLIALLALMLGRILGRILHLQKLSNRLGHQASEAIARAAKSPPGKNGFNVATLLFCAAPLAIVGAVQDGLSGYCAPLIIKAVMDGLTVMSFVALFGWVVIPSALPVFAFQGTITLLCLHLAKPFLEQYALLDSVNATGGLLVMFMAVVIFEVRKVELTDYLPSLAVAPLLTYWWH